MTPLFLALAALSCPPGDAKLRAPAGFAVDLVAEAPAILWPSANVCLDDGSLLVGEDRMDMPGPSDQPLDRLILLRFQPDGSFEKQVFADKLNAVFGLELVDGAVFVMNMPFLTRLVDTDGDGVADERKQLLSDLGPPAPGWPGGFNDHIVSGIRLSHDGWLYVAVGDKGIPLAHGTDGSTLTLRGGGVVRLRPDGSHLELVGSGLRNILDVAIDADGELFTHDNTDDGLGWWTRLTHVVYGGYYGYPWDYHEHPERMLPCMKDYGGGSPTGGLVYREASWPKPYAGSLFYCEWAKQKLRRFEVERAGATFKVVKDEDFLEAGDVQEFRPTDVCESPDGRFLYISDWGYGGWTNPAETGRIWRVRRADDDPKRPSAMKPLPKDVPGLVEALGDPSYRRRLRAQRALSALGKAAVPALQELVARSSSDRQQLHASWALAGIPDNDSWMASQFTSGIAIVRRVAARAAGAWRWKLLEQALVASNDPVFRREGLSALIEHPVPQLLESSRELDGSVVPLWIVQAAQGDGLESFLARRLLRSLDYLPAMYPRSLATELMRDRYEVSTIRQLIADGTQSRLDPQKVIWSIGMLAELARKPPAWDGKWWSIQPAKLGWPAHTVDWERTPLILSELESCLDHRRQDVRKAAIEAVRRIPDRGAATKLRERYFAETELEMKELVLAILGELGDEGCADLLRGILGDASADPALRTQAIETACAVHSEGTLGLLVELASDPRSTPEQVVGCVRALARFHDARCVDAVMQRLHDERAGVRPAAVAALVEWLGKDALAAVEPLLNETDIEGRKAVLRAIRKLASNDKLAGKDETELLLRAWNDSATREDAALALTALPNAKALDAYVELLSGTNLDGQQSARRALAAIREEVRPAIDALAQIRKLAPAQREALRAIYSEPAPILEWQLSGPFPRNDQRTDVSSNEPNLDELAKEKPWVAAHARAKDGFLDLELAVAKQSNVAAFARATLTCSAARKAQMRVGSDDMLTVWINGALVHDNPASRAWHEDEDKFDVDLKAGANEILLRIGQGSGQWSFNAKLSGPGSGPLFDDRGAADPDAELRAWVLAHNGDPARGFRIFRDSQSGPMCIRCHKVFGNGAEIGPDLSDVGAKYPREELLDSILAPSKRIVDGYKTVWFELDDARTLFGLVKGEDKGEILLYDNQGQLVRVDKSSIVERGTNERSAMPDGLSHLVSREEFADLVAWLATLKGAPK